MSKSRVSGGKIFGRIKIGRCWRLCAYGDAVYGGYHCDKRKPSQIPRMPPIAVVNTEIREKVPAPQRLGMNPPTVEPTAIKIMIIDLELTQRV